MATLQHNYPNKNIILGYSLLGGAIGGICVECLLAIIFYSNYDSFYENFYEFLRGIPIYSLLGMGFGLIPAFLTGYLIAKRQIFLASKSKYIEIFLIGFLVIGSMTLCVTLPLLFTEILDWLKYGCIFAIIGGLSSLIVGKLILPKDKI